MDENRPMTKKERKEARRLERLANEASGNGSSFLKWLIIGGGSVLFLVFFGFLVFLIKQNQTSEPVVLSSSGWSKGAEEAQVTLVEFGDLQCPACKAYEPFVRSAVKDFENEMKFVFKHFPLSGHQHAMLAAQAAEAAGLQGKFWEMHDWLYDNQESWAASTGIDAREKMIAAAAEFGVDVEKMNEDMDKPEIREKILAQQNEGVEVGVNATPTFFINNKRVDTPRNYEDFKKIIEDELK